MTEQDGKRQQLLDAALGAAAKAYAPYSGFRVGAAVMDADGNIISGCNVENSSYGLSVCAERVAIQNAVSNGWREITELAVVAAGGETDAPPCGACRQAMLEFSPEMTVTYRANGGLVSRRASELLPDAFEGGDGTGVGAGG